MNNENINLEWKVRHSERESLKAHLAISKERLSRLEKMRDNASSETFKDFATDREQNARERVSYYEERLRLFKLSGQNIS